MAYRLKNIRILLIEHNQPVRMLIRSILLDLGFGLVDTAEEMEQGWNLYCAHEPDIILMDWRFNHPQGLDFIRRVRTSSASPVQHVPIILMTAYTNKDLLFKARDAGITEFLIKPFTVETLTRQVTQLVEKPRDFVISQGFIGPDRRRRHAAIDEIEKKRKKDQSKTQKEDV